jgi:hypothetical protein
VTRRRSSATKKGSPVGEPFVHPRPNPSVPSGLAEELALESAAALDHEERAADLWRARQYAAARRELAAHEAAVARCRVLESALEKEAP